MNYLDERYNICCRVMKISGTLLEYTCRSVAWSLIFCVSADHSGEIVAMRMSWLHLIEEHF